MRFFTDIVPWIYMFRCLIQELFLEPEAFHVSCVKWAASVTNILCMRQVCNCDNFCHLGVCVLYGPVRSPWCTDFGAQVTCAELCGAILWWAILTITYSITYELIPLVWLGINEFTMNRLRHDKNYFEIRRNTFSLVWITMSLCFVFGLLGQEPQASDLGHLQWPAHWKQGGSLSWPDQVCAGRATQGEALVR